MNPQTDLEDRLAGVLLGTAMGDALGLPYEGMSRRRVQRTLGIRAIKHRFLLDRGMLSDDTEHACMVAQSLAESHGAPNAFARALGGHLRWWLLGLPAGIGLGTLQGILKLWLGYSPDRSGVNSAGNGPAMRAPLLGVFAAGSPDLLSRLVNASTRITHSDPRAEAGALAVAHAAAIASGVLPDGPAAILRAVRDLMHPCEMGELLARAVEFAHTPTSDFADALGLQRGVTGFVNDTVPVALHCWARHPGDLEAAVTEVVRLGGDTDTTAAIVGGLVGATGGMAVIPKPWLDGLLEWPRSVTWMRRLAQALARGEAPPKLLWIATLPRNLLFILGVYGLILRRGLPPY